MSDPIPTPPVHQGFYPPQQTPLVVTVPGPAPYPNGNGAPAVKIGMDPTDNVVALITAQTHRQDDLRNAAKELSDAKALHSNQIADLRSTQSAELAIIRAAHQQALDVAESRRLDAIRQVDREDVTKSATQALTAIQALAQETRTTAETLRAQNAAAVQQRDTQAAATNAEITKRLSALELALSEGKGKQAVVDPAMGLLMQEVRSMAAANAANSGKDTGQSSLRAAQMAQATALKSTIQLGIGAILLLITIATFMLRQQAPAPPAYVPAPYGTQLPTAPPAVGGR